MFEKIMNRKMIKKLKEGAVKELLLTEDGSDKKENVKCGEIYVVTPEFYKNYVKGKEEKVTELLKCKAIAILYSAKVEDSITFVHRVKFDYIAEKIESDGIKYTAQRTLPLGCGIYVWGIDKPNNPWMIHDNKCFKISNYEGQYLKLVYYQDCRYDAADRTEYLLLKTCQRENIERM